MLFESSLSIWPMGLLTTACFAVWAVITFLPVLNMWTRARKIPGPFAWPILGNALTFMSGPEKTLSTVVEMFENHGNVIRLWVGTKLVIGIASPSDAQLIMTHPKVINRDHHIMKTVNGFVNNCLLTARDDKARARRKLIAPAFHFKILASYAEIFAQKADQLAIRLADMADGTTVDIKEQLCLCTLDSIVETAIGVNLTSEVDAVRDMKDNVDKGLTLAQRRMMCPWLMLDWLYPWTADGKEAATVNKVSYDFFKTIMTTKLEQNRTKKESGIAGNKGKAQSFLDTVFDTTGTGENLLNEDEVRGESLTLLAAGMDTSANTMAYTLILLGMHPEYQEKVFQEQQDIFQGSFQPATLEDLPKMVVLDLVVKETLRLFPPSTFYPREIPEDIKISNGYILPAGCTVFISSQNLQRDVQNFDSPERFWPERWLPKNSVGRHPYAYIPFGAGVRICMGIKYSQLQMKATLSRLLRQFRFSSDYTMKELDRVELSITNKSAVGYDVKIFPRNQNN